jgi:hypothetical protein
MHRLLKLSALVEAPTGLALIAAPGLVVRLLLREEITGPAFAVARVAGVALLALGVACWLASGGEQSGAARGAVSAMAIYNLGVAIVLAAAGLQSPPGGILLWPVVVAHAALAVWCVASLQRKPTRA